MNDAGGILNLWWAQADGYRHSDRWTREEKLRLLTFQEGAFWGYATATSDHALMQRAYRLREQVGEMLKELRECDSQKA